MAELTQLGLLEQPHTSAGRIPSQLGYRVYINQIMNKKPMSESDQKLIDDALSSAIQDPDHLLKEVSHVLASMTKLAVASTSPSVNNCTIKHIQFVPLGRRSGMIVLALSTGIAKSRMFKCDYDLTPQALGIFDRVLNEKLFGVPVAKIDKAFIQTLAASIGEISMLMPTIFFAILDAAKEATDLNVQLDGQLNLMFVPEFKPESVQKLFDFLDQESNIEKLFLQNQNRNIKVLIGNETNIDELKESSVIISKYTLSQGTSGSIGIIGPMRMDYGKVISNLEYLSLVLGRLLGDILDLE